MQVTGACTWAHGTACHAVHAVADCSSIGCIAEALVRTGLQVLLLAVVQSIIVRGLRELACSCATRCTLTGALLFSQSQLTTRNSMYVSRVHLAACCIHRVCNTTFSMGQVSPACSAQAIQTFALQAGSGAIFEPSFSPAALSGAAS